LAAPAPSVGAPIPLLGLEQGGLGALTTCALMEPVDASVIEARSTCLEREPWRGLGRHAEPTGLWSLLEELSTGLFGTKFQCN